VIFGDGGVTKISCGDNVEAMRGLRLCSPADQPTGNFEMTAISFELIMKTLNRSMEIAAVALFATLLYLVLAP
jgi:hypothetical protein